MRLCLWPFALAVASSMALADGEPARTPEQEARWLIGREYMMPLPGERIIPDESNCTYHSGGRLDIDGIQQKGWSASQVRCQGRTVVMLERFVGWKDPVVSIWRIIDTLVLPRYDVVLNPGRPNPLTLFEAGNCELDGKTDTYFIALIRLGKRDKIDWRTGVEQAWTFDTEHGRIVPLSTKRIVCHRPTPP